MEETTAENFDSRAFVRDGEKLYLKLAPSIKTSACTRFMVLNIDAGDYVIATSRETAMDAYEEKFPGAPGYIRKIHAIERVSRS